MHTKLTFTIRETAEALGIGRNLCYQQVKAGTIPAIRTGKRLLVPRKALEKLLEDPKSFTSPGESM